MGSNGSQVVRDAFNAAAAPEARAERAFHRYDYHDNVAYERIRIVGRKADGSALDVESDRLRPGTDLAAAARELAAKTIGPPPAPPPGE